MTTVGRICTRILVEVLIFASTQTIACFEFDTFTASSPLFLTGAPIKR